MQRAGDIALEDAADRSFGQLRCRGGGADQDVQRPVQRRAERVAVVGGVVDGWGTARERVIAATPPTALDPSAYPAGSMGPTVEAARAFAEIGGDAVIGSLADIDNLVRGGAGTLISPRCRRVEFRDRAVSSLAAV